MDRNRDEVQMKTKLPTYKWVIKRLYKIGENADWLGYSASPMCDNNWIQSHIAFSEGERPEKMLKIFYSKDWAYIQRDKLVHKDPAFKNAKFGYPRMEVVCLDDMVDELGHPLEPCEPRRQFATFAGGGPGTIEYEKKKEATIDPFRGTSVPVDDEQDPKHGWPADTLGEGRIEWKHGSK
jgi:hypothetical protein